MSFLTFLTLIIIFHIMMWPLMRGRKKKYREDVYGNSGWRTLKLKKLRNKERRPRKVQRLRK